MSRLLSVRPTPPHRRALLVFADVPALDLARRRWPTSFAGLLNLPQLESLAPVTDCHLFTSRWALVPDSLSSRVQTHVQKGGSFGESLSEAVASLAELGYQEIVIVGRDCPSLTASDVEVAFDGLASHRVVLGPDHSGGLYLIALRAADRHLLTRVHWRQNTDCRQMTLLSGSDRTLLLETKQDLDNLVDLRLLARAGQNLSSAALQLLDRLLVVPEVPTPAGCPGLVAVSGVSSRAPPSF